MNDIFVRAYFKNGMIVDVPINDTNTYTRCCSCDRPIQISLDNAFESYLDNQSEYESFSDFFNDGFICEQCAEAEKRANEKKVST